MNIITYNQRNHWITATNQVLISYMNRNSECTIGISGGSTPYPIYASWDSLQVDWSSVNLVQIDERYVPKGNPESNSSTFEYTTSVWKMVNQYLIFEYGDDPACALQEYISQLPVKMNIALLGMGIDGHFASLFPKSEYLDQSVGNHAILTTAPTEYKTSIRYSLSPEYISKSDHIIILLQGIQKKTLLESALRSNVSISKFPLLYLSNHPSCQVFCLIEE